MKAIWKFILDPDNLTLEMPKDSEILSAREQGEEICVWALVDPKGEKEKRTFDVFITGQEIDPSIERKFIGTAFLRGGSLVFHIFARV